MIRKVLLLIVVIFITKTTQERPNICTGHPTGTLVFNAKNCSEFYNCFHGIPIPDACPSGQLFNDIINKCDNAERVECFNCPVNDFNDIPVPNECSQFVRCSKYSDPEQITCSVGLYFDPTVNMCNVANKVECKFKARCPKNNEFLMITPDRDTCNKYFVCINSTAKEYVCPSLLHFNRMTNQCDLPENANCPIVVPSDIAQFTAFTFWQRLKP